MCLFHTFNVQYLLETKEPLRQRFANSLQWYNRLQQSTNQFVDGALQRARQTIPLKGIQLEVGDSPHTDENSRNSPQIQSLFTPENSPSPLFTPETSPSPPSEEERRHGKRARRESAGSVPLRSRPSDYLRARCPMCFGGCSRFSDRYVIDYYCN